MTDIFHIIQSSYSEFLENRFFKKKLISFAKHSQRFAVTSIVLKPVGRDKSCFEESSLLSARRTKDKLLTRSTLKILKRKQTDLRSISQGKISHSAFVLIQMMRK